MGGKQKLRSDKRQRNTAAPKKKSFDLIKGDKHGLPRGRGLKTTVLLVIVGVLHISFQIQSVSSLALLVGIQDFYEPIIAMVINQQATSLLSLSDSYPIPDIKELVESKTTRTCPPGLMPITNTHFPTSVVHPTGRKIPKIIHITSRYRCATPAVINNVDKWRFQNHSVYFHDDEAIDKLFTHPYTRSQFPTLREGLKCVTNGATKADLWRYLVVYMYGDIYTDIDNSPTGFNGETIQETDDAFFTIEQLGIMSQYFLASSVGHPLMAKMLEVGVERLKATVNVMVNNPAKATGPGACKVGFIHFMAEVGVETNGYIEAGVYFGANNRSVTVVGKKQRSQDFVNRNGLGGNDKAIYYKALGIAHFNDLRKTYPRQGSISCMEHLKRTNGTDKVANYHYVEELKAYREVNTTTVVNKF